MLYVLDTFALMSYLKRENNWEIVRSIVLETLAGRSRSHLSIINLGELYYMQSRKSGVVKADSSVRFVRRAGIIIEPASSDRVFAGSKAKSDGFNVLRRCLCRDARHRAKRNSNNR